MNVIDICPVGALTSKDFRFKARVWYLERADSVCGACANGCNIDMYHREGRLFRFQPRANPAVNDYWMCDAGRMSCGTLQGEARLFEVLVRGETEFAPSDWTTAVAAASEGLRAVASAHGPTRSGSSYRREPRTKRSWLRDALGRPSVPPSPASRGRRPARSPTTS